jgi:hypothetical protein
VRRGSSEHPAPALSRRPAIPQTRRRRCPAKFPARGPRCAPPPPLPAGEGPWEPRARQRSDGGTRLEDRAWRPAPRGGSGGCGALQSPGRGERGTGADARSPIRWRLGTRAPPPLGGSSLCPPLRPAAATSRRHYPLGPALPLRARPPRGVRVVGSARLPGASPRCPRAAPHFLAWPGPRRLLSPSRVVAAGVPHLRAFTRSHALAETAPPRGLAPAARSAANPRTRLTRQTFPS